MSKDIKETVANSSQNAEQNQLASRRNFLKVLGIGAGAVATLGFPSILKAQSKDTIKVGVLHSLSGTMAISETVLKD